jgi:O-antigen/teichoic acid export membrane protein
VRPDGDAGGDVRRLAGGAAVQLAGKLVGRGSAFFLQLALARFLGPGPYGLYTLGHTVFLITGLAATLGLEHGAIRFASRHLGEDPARLGAVLRTCLRLALGSSLAIAATLYFAAPGLAVGVFDKPGLAPVLALLACGLPLLALLRVAAAGTRVSQRMHYSAVAEDLVQPLTNLTLVAVFWLLGWRLLGAAGAMVLSFAVAAAVAAAFLRRTFPAVTARGGPAPRSAELVGFSIPAAFAGLLGLGTLWADRLLVGIFRSEAETGIYGAAAHPATVLALLLTSFNAIFAPMIAELYQKGEQRRLEQLFRTGTRWGVCLAMPAFLAVVLFPRELIAVVLGAGYLPGDRAMVILTSGQMANVATGAVGFLLVMSGRQRLWMWMTAAALLANVGLNSLWIPRYGLVGAAAATACVLAALFVAALWAVHRSLGLWPYDRRVVKDLAAAAVTAAALGLIRWAGPGSQTAMVALVLAGAPAVFWISRAWLGFEAEEREIFRSLRRRSAASPTTPPPTAEPPPDRHPT